MESKRAPIKLKPPLQESCDALFMTRSGRQCNVMGIGTGMVYLMADAFTRLIIERCERGIERTSLVVYTDEGTSIMDLFQSIHAFINASQGIPQTLTVPQSAWTMAFKNAEDEHYVSYSYQNPDATHQYIRIKFVVVNTVNVEVESGFDMVVLHQFDHWCHSIPGSFINLLDTVMLREDDHFCPIVVYTNFKTGNVNQWYRYFEDNRTITTLDVSPELVAEIPKSVQDESEQFQRDYLCR